MENVEHTHRNADPLKVKIIKGQRDTYGWEVSVQGADGGDILAEIRKVDESLRDVYKDKLGG